MKRWKPLTPEELAAATEPFYAALNDERDLACVLKSVSYLEEYLASLLGRAFVNAPRAAKLLAPLEQGAVSTFAARAELAYALGLIGDGLRKNLKLTANIRNAFAHSHEERTFADEEIVALCSALAMPRVETAFVVGDSDVPHVPFHERRHPPRDRFVIACSMMATRVVLTALAVQHAPPCDRDREWDAAPPA